MLGVLVPELNTEEGFQTDCSHLSGLEMNCLHYFTQLRIIFTGIVWSEHRIIEKLAISLLSSRLSISLSVPLALSFFSLLVKLNSIQNSHRDEKKCIN